MDYSLLQPLFNWLPINLIKKTFESSTQHDLAPASSFLKKTYCSLFHAFNVKRRSELVAANTVCSDTPAVDDRSTCAQIFVGTKTLVADFYRMKTDKQFLNTLEDNIRKRGAMYKLISDSSQSKIHIIGYRTFYVPSSLIIGNLSHTTNVKTSLKGDIKM